MKNRWSGFLALVILISSFTSYAGFASAADAVLSKIVLSSNEVTLQQGDTAALTATAVFSDGTTSNVTVSTDWKSDNTTIATVYNGTVSAKAEGEATVVATYKEKVQSVQVHVTKKVKALTSSVQSLNLRSSGTGQVDLTATYSDNTTAQVSGDATWTSDNQKVATVVNGLVTAQGAGTANIKAVYGQQTVTIAVQVEQVKRLDVSSSEVSLLLKDTEKVKLSATFPDGSVQDVTESAEWSSSNAAVADVLKGTITGYSAGKATITGKYGTMSATISVDVDQTNKLKASESNIFLRLDESKKIQVSAVYPDGTVTDITDKATWTSSDEKIATVNKGTIMAIGAGSATVTAKYGDKTVSIKTDVETSRYLDLSEDKLSLNAKESKKLKLTATYVTGTEEDITSKAEWKSSNEDIAFVSAGEVTGYKTGEATITASYGGKTVTATVSVNVPGDLSLSSKTATIDIDEDYTATLTATYADGRKEDVTQDAEWASSAEDIASVSKGTITGKSAGKAVITATYNGKKLTINVQVGLVDRLETDSRVIALGAQETKQLKVTGVKSGGTKTDVTKDATWTTSNVKVVEVSEGLIKANGSGKATVTASYGKQNITFTVEVDVAQKIEADAIALSLKSGDQKTIAIVVKSSDGKEKDVTAQAEWKTSNYKVATVKKGQVTAVSYGKANIQAKFGGKVISVPVDVDTLKYLQTDEVALNLKAGQLAKVTATATYKDESEKDVSKPAVWSSSRIVVATVKDGNIKAQGKGKAVITVKYAGKMTKIQVTVQ
ncbi:Ig-like domain-containing protein [Paenibacillus sp. FSL P2-0173]|uniref:Ig-like domain-containing protein n=1 Tax=Paenibacillus sp. FSL P2-0173 TaxID=2921627 RepID=UPI0030F9B299